MLSGNKPLVHVLTGALNKELSKNKKRLNKDVENISTESIIREAYHFKKDIFNQRLEYIPGSGIAKQKEGAMFDTPHVVIFDEAQRAWSQKQMIDPGQSGRKEWQEEQFPFSEPGLLLWDMNQREWGVFVCLVGGGQEINTGEAGIIEWLRALNNNAELSEWEIHIADELYKDENYNRIDIDGKDVKFYCNELKKKERLFVDNSLHLTDCKRSSRNTDVSKFVEALLDGNSIVAKELYLNIKSDFPIYITRDVEQAKMYLRRRRKELLPVGFVDGEHDHDIRIGMLMSSKASRLRPLGFEVKKVNKYDKVTNWFLDHSDSIESSNFLEIALNEFFVQGLELDLSAVMWDADFRYDQNTKKWQYFNFSGKKWTPQNTPNHKTVRMYMKNAYRVLLTRARAGMVLLVPEGVDYDATRLPEYYDCTYDYLLSLGIERLEDITN